ncbi:MAG TPA: hypothetical protein VFC19_51440 [Candidatus Limnocylindrales bacterium]|nr:hypothetical protein [Candidatus Limnocylindrales bacterium]
MKRTLGTVAATALFGMMCAWAFWHSFWPPRGPIEGPEEKPGLRSACVILDPARQQQLVPDAKASHRTLHRRISECTLTGGGRELTIKISDHSKEGVARSTYLTEEDIRKRFGRHSLPPLENPPLGQQAVLDLGYGDGTATATVVARKGIRVVEVSYAVPATITVGKGPDPKHYSTVKAVAVEVAGELLK